MRRGARLLAVVLISLAGVVAAALLVGPRLGDSSAPATALPSASTAAQSSLAPSSELASVAPTLAPTPVPTPRLAACATTDEQGQLAIRLEWFSDVGREWVLSVYADGTLLTAGLIPLQRDPDYWMIGRRLTPAGVAHLRAEILASGLF